MSTKALLKAKKAILLSKQRKKNSELFKKEKFKLEEDLLVFLNDRKIFFASSKYKQSFDITEQSISLSNESDPQVRALKLWCKSYHLESKNINESQQSDIKKVLAELRASFKIKLQVIRDA
jgi:hypothetical protein